MTEHRALKSDGASSSLIAPAASCAGAQLAASRALWRLPSCPKLQEKLFRFVVLLLSRAGILCLVVAFTTAFLSTPAAELPAGRRLRDGCERRADTSVRCNAFDWHVFGLLQRNFGQAAGHLSCLVLQIHRATVPAVLTRPHPQVCAVALEQDLAEEQNAALISRQPIWICHDGVLILDFVFESERNG